MDPQFLEAVRRDWQLAYAAESAGDYPEALRLYRLVAGASAMVSATEKDGFRVEFGKLDDKIAELIGLIGAGTGAGKLRRIPVVNEPTLMPGQTFDQYWSGAGYPWG